MGRARENASISQSCEIVDFDAALLDACAPDVRAELLREAKLLVGVFAPDGDAAKVKAMAEQLNGGHRDAEMERAHARRLACALKRLAEDSAAPDA